MSESAGNPKTWWLSLPGLLTAIAALLTALTGLFVAIQQAPKTAVHDVNRQDPCVDLPFEERPVSCLERK